MLLPYFEWVGETVIGLAIRDSLWLFPVIQCAHLLGLAMLGGTILVVDLRLLGLGLRSRTAGWLVREMHPWLVGSLAVTIVSGVLLFSSETLRAYYSAPFWWKMQFLAAAILFTFTLRRRGIDASEASGRPYLGALVAVVSLGLWFGVGFSGRWIAFY